MGVGCKVWIFLGILFGVEMRSFFEGFGLSFGALFSVRMDGLRAVGWLVFGLQFELNSCLEK